MKTSLKLISLILCTVIAIVSVFSGCDNDPVQTPSAGSDSEVQFVGENKKFAYTVIIPEDASEKEREAVKLITETVKSQYGSVVFKNDSKPIVEGQKELLIGNTNRQESQDMLKKIKDNRKNCALDYCVTNQNGNIVIAGGSVDATIKAIEMFVENVLLAEKASFTSEDEVFYQPDIKNFSIAGTDISEYTIVMPENDNHYYNSDILSLCETIYTNCGVAIETVYDNVEKLPEHGIYIDTTQANSFNPSDSKACRVVENNGDLFISSKTKASITSGIKSVETLLKDAKESKVVIEKGYDNTPKNVETADAYELVWSDEFNGNSLDSSKWVYQARTVSGQNGGTTYYTNDPENISVSDGMLHITGRYYGDDKNSFTTGLVQTKNRMTYTYGYVEARIRLPKGKGLWPAFWAKGPGPAFQEIDFVEMFAGNSSQILSTIHRWWPGGHQAVSSTGRYYNLPQGETFNDKFHVFGCEWTPEEFRFMIDGSCYHTIDITAEELDLHHTPIYLILCLQIGQSSVHVDETTPMPAVIDVDYVRLYQRSNISELNLYNK